MLFDWVIERPQPHPQRHVMCALLHLAREIDRPDWGTEDPKDISSAIRFCAPSSRVSAEMALLSSTCIPLIHISSVTLCVPSLVLEPLVERDFPGAACDGPSHRVFGALVDCFLLSPVVGT